ncbi:type IX secretion system motor protein PorM/GldM [Crocinitomix algicola]|uniref:type IX secretion system motor protein PorM/GldM n=1 Tax=Crocinitomix algicola TaxID=1740263 RepID=UPI000872480E|nr:GldM family protein [Crocinitomix algicola]
MAGGKETSRQKMIGMMYLVLTALLALNVTKEVVNAFVTINDKLDGSATIINNKIQEDYSSFDLKRMSIEAKKGDISFFQIWQDKSKIVESKTNNLINYLLTECNEMIKTAEGEDWIIRPEGKKSNDQVTLKPLKDILIKDNYDVPTQLFIGSDPLNPKERGRLIRDKIHNYRDTIASIMANYSENGKQYRFDPPKNYTDLSKSLQSSNPIDTAKIAHFYRSLTIPDKLYDVGEEREMPWVSATFNHAPLVAAAAMFTSLKVDVKNGEALAVEYLLNKIKEPIYVINKIEPMAVAPSGYINQGDSMDLKVLIAAYDSNQVYTLKWGMDEDTLPENWQTASGKINLSGAAPGIHRVKGAIGVKERNQTIWKPWSFDYTVGQPMGVISQPNLRLLYRGYENEIEAAASGFSQDKISISASSGCQIIKRNGKFFVKVGAGIRQATISVKGEKKDGSIVTIATNSFDVRPLPRPEIFLGGISNGQRPGCSSVGVQNRIVLKYDPGVPIAGVVFDIIDGKVEVEGMYRKGKVLNGGRLDEDALQILRQSCGKRVTITCKYKDPSRVTKNASPLVFNVR